MSLVAAHARAHPGFPPDAGQRAFLPKERLVLEPNFNGSAFGVFGEDFRDFCGDVFFKSREDLRARYLLE